MAAMRLLALAGAAAAAQDAVGWSDAVVTVELDLEAATSPFPPYWKRSFGSGHAALGLRPDWQAALARAARDIGLAGIRQHGLFDDVRPKQSVQCAFPYRHSPKACPFQSQDMDPVVMAANGLDVLHYNFSKIDVLWDAHVKNGVRPVVELSFRELIRGIFCCCATCDLLVHSLSKLPVPTAVPLALANCSSARYPQPGLPACKLGGWVRTGVAAPPRRWADWQALVEATVQHAVGRYGLAEVKRWDFEVVSADALSSPAHHHLLRATNTGTV